MMLLASISLVTFAAASIESPQGEFAVQPNRVEVGQPFELSLLLDDPTALDPGHPELDDSWVLLDEGMELEGEGVRFTWSVASLEAGDRLVLFSPLDDKVQAPEPVRVRVASVLGEEEIEPRPLRGLPDDFGTVNEASSSRPVWQWILLGALGGLLLATACLLIWKLLRRPKPAPRAPGRLERFDALETSDADTIALHHAWAQLLREGVDAQLSQTRAAMTEEEWLASLAGETRLAGELKTGVASALQACCRVRFGGEASSSFAKEELQGQVRALLVSLGDNKVEGSPKQGKAGRAA